MWPREINVDGYVVGRARVVDVGTSAYLWNLEADSEGMIPLFTLLHKDEATDINDVDPPVIVGGAFVPPQNFTHGYGKILYMSDPVPLDFLFSSHNYSRATSISDSGFVTGTSTGPPPSEPECGEVQDHFRAVAWPEAVVSPDNLATLGTAENEAVTQPLDVNNASPSMIVGAGDDPYDVLLPCRDRALFWEDAMSQPMALPYLTVNGQPAADNMRAEAISDPFPDARLEVVGHSAGLLAAVLWRRVNGVWEAIDLNDVISCGGEQWANVAQALDINDCGWIVGHGVLTNGSPRAFVLVPYSSCPGDIGGGEMLYPDGAVNVDDLLTLINRWGTSDCIADISGNGTVDVDDLLAVINGWGPCSCFPHQPPIESLSQEFGEVGLTQADWSGFLDVLGTGTESERQNYNCWMQRYLSRCERCPACPGRDPFLD